MPINPPKTSFIPKKSLIKKPEPKKDAPVHWFMALSLLLVLLSATSYGALFLYKSIMEKRIESLANSLERARGAFETSLIETLQKVDTRLKSADTLLVEHIAVTPLFDLFEENTIDNLRFKNFNYSKNEDGVFKISMRGEAEDFASIALQSDIFSENKFIKNHIFSNLNVDSSGNVVFNFSADVDRSILSYQNFINNLAR